MPPIEATKKFQSYLCFFTLLKKEILRFLSVGGQTLLAPVVTASLYLLVFGVSLGSRVSVVENFTYIQFVLPGLVLMGVVNNSFSNVSSSLFISRYLGNIVELLVTPISPLQFIFAYTIAAMVRGLLVASFVIGVSMFFTTLPWTSPWLSWSMLAVAAFLFAQFGVLASIFSSSFDSLSMYTNFLILPLIYLGGLFYPVELLPPFWSAVSKINPLYYLIAGYRKSVLGEGALSVEICLLLSFVLALALFLVNWWIVHKGYKLRQ